MYKRVFGGFLRFASLQIPKKNPASATGLSQSVAACGVRPGGFAHSPMAMSVRSIARRLRKGGNPVGLSHPPRASEKTMSVEAATLMWVCGQKEIKPHCSRLKPLSATRSPMRSRERAAQEHASVRLYASPAGRSFFKIAKGSRPMAIISRITTSGLSSSSGSFTR